MKNFIIDIALVLILVLSAVAIAEVANDSVPALTEEAPAGAPAEGEAPAEPAEAETDAAPAEDKAQAGDLQGALDAWRAAKEARRVDELEEELKGYVEAGSLTQEQADLILKNAKERSAAPNGERPNCGVAFGKDDMPMNRGGHRGGMMGSQMNGNPMNGQQPGQMNGQMNGQMPQQPGQMNGQMGGQMNGQMGGQMNGQMNGQQAPQR